MRNSTGFKDELAVIMPVYNEEGAIRNVLDKWLKELRAIGMDFVFHVYNDGSKDSSLKILKELARINKEMIVHDKPNSGHGPTILTGYRESTNPAWIFQVDSDDELGPGPFNNLWHKRHNYDLLIGHRIGRKSNFSRRMLSLVSREAVRIFYAPGISDVNIPYRLMRNECFRKSFDSIPKNTFAPNVILSGYACLKKWVFRFLSG